MRVPTADSGDSSGSIPESLHKVKESKLEPYQERVIAEKRDLDEKAERLNAFIASTDKPILPPGELSRLRVQSAIMDAYAEILSARIDSF
jgi:hypothetical protein